MSSDPEVCCTISRLYGTPAFVVPNVEDIPSREFKRVCGATFRKDKNVWLFPAFYPYIEDALRDLRIVVPGIVFSDEAVEHTVSEIGQREGSPIPEGYEFATIPYAHQLEGLNFVLKHLRGGVFYDMGLGKTKIVVDLLRICRQKALILSPLIGVGNWLAEIERHSGGDLSAHALFAESKAAKAAKREHDKVCRPIRKALKEAKKDLEKAKKEMRLDACYEAEARIARYTHELEDTGSGATKARLADIEYAKDKDALVVTYDTAKRYADAILQRYDYEIIVADESHYMRNNRSARTKAAQALASKAYRRILLSGTPSLGDPMHLFGQLYFLARYAPGKSWWHFRKHFLVFSEYNDKMVVGYKNLDMLNERVQRLSIRKTKEECLDLPERQILDVPFSLRGDQKRIYNELVGEACASLEDGSLYDTDSAATVLQKLLQVLSGFFIKPPPDICDGCEWVEACVESKIKPYTKRCVVEQKLPLRETLRMKSNPKLEAFAELMEAILVEPRNKCIVWCHFSEELDIVEEWLREQNLGYVRVDGSNSNRSSELGAQFAEDNKCRVYLAQIATGVAINLTCANYTVYFGLNYSLDSYLQSMDRNYRIGQEVPVFVYRLVAEGSILDYVAKALQRNIDVANLLTSRIDCLLCSHHNECLENGVEPFTKKCIHESRVSRVTTRPKKL